MKNNNNKKSSNAKASISSKHNNREFELFKSRVANAVLDYMEAQSDLDLIECLEKSSTVLANISVQVEKVLDSEKLAIQDLNKLSELGEDLFSVRQQTISNTIH